ncbi:hypothetical protein Csa_001855 [Cucumis sativus]|uniref:Uncharacterized protein n=1 Tax=Cucumis sativus TaxID=3659 RepID=A0A0A0LDQ9_CUCSA|nr:hypothetical protein Csa_001855 [Cucumis sativus]
METSADSFHDPVRIRQLFLYSLRFFALNHKLWNNMQGLEVPQDIHLTILINDACKEIQLIHPTWLVQNFGDCPTK